MRAPGKAVIIAGGLMVFVAAAACSAAGIGENLLTNSGFEEGLKGWSVPSWRTNAIKPEIDKTVFQGPGHASVKMVGQAGKESILIQNFPDSKAKRYKLSGWIKTRDFENNWQAVIHAECAYKDRDGKTKYKYFGGGNTSHTVSDMDWKKLEGEGESPEGTLNITIYLLTWHPSGKSCDAALPNRGTVWFDNISLIPVSEATGKTDNAKTDNIAIRKVYTQKWGHIFEPKERPEITVEFINGFPQSKKIIFQYTLKDYDEKVLLSESQTLEVPEKTTQDKKITLPALDIGYYTCEIVLVNPEGSIPIDKRILGLAVPVPRGTNEGKQFMALNYCGTGGKGIEWLPKIGVQAYEVGFRFASIEPSQGEFRFPETNSVLEICKKEGITPIGYIMFEGEHTPSWASSAPPGEPRKAYMAKPEAFENFVYEIVKRYGNDIKTWHLSMEADCRSDYYKRGMDEYLDMVKAGYTGAKRANPDVIVGGCGVAVDHLKGYPFSKEVWKKAHDFLDGMFFDAYPDGHVFGPGQRIQIPEDQMVVFDEGIKLVKSYGPEKRFAIEETGYSIELRLPVGCIYDRKRADVLSRLYIVNRAIEEMNRVVWFLLYDAGYSSRDKSGGMSSGKDYGLLKLSEEEGEYPNPRAGFCAYATTAKFLLGAENPQRIALHKDIYAYLFQKGTGSRLALWTIEKEPVLFRIDLPPSAKCYDVVSRPLTPRKEGGASIFNLTDSPVFIFDETKNSGLYGQILAKAKYELPPVKIFCTFTRMDAIDVKVINQLAENVEGKLSIEAPSGWQAAKPYQAVALAPKEEKVVKFQLKGSQPVPRVPGAFNLTFDSTNHLPVSAAANPQFFKVARLFQAPVIDGDLNEYKNMEAIVLDNRSYIKPVEAVEYGGWTGPNDLSVRAWVAYDMQNFYFAAEVTDDVFCQKLTGTSIWANDSFQIIFDPLNDAKMTVASGCNEDDYEFGIALTPRGPQVFQWAGKGSGATGRLVASGKLVVKREGDKTFYEWAIPWDEISPLQPEPGRVFGFNFTALDSEKGETANYWMGLTDGIVSGVIPLLFHNFVLE